MTDTNALCSIIEANQNLYVTKAVNKHADLSMKNDQPASTEEVMALSKHFMDQNREAYEFLAKMPC